MACCMLRARLPFARAGTLPTWETPAAASVQVLPQSGAGLCGQVRKTVATVCNCVQLCALRKSIKMPHTPQLCALLRMQMHAERLACFHRISFAMECCSTNLRNAVCIAAFRYLGSPYFTMWLQEVLHPSMLTHYPPAPKRLPVPQVQYFTTPQVPHQQHSLPYMP